jgi:hypothetical protein
VNDVLGTIAALGGKQTVKLSRAKNDMLLGALCCIVGIIATWLTIMADMKITVIFWGAILYGAIRFFKGFSAIF